MARKQIETIHIETIDMTAHPTAEKIAASPTSPGTIEHRAKRALYRATHRGTKELDWLVGRFAQSVLPPMSSVDMDRFERFLAVPDPDLHSWIMHPEGMDGHEFQDLVHALRAYHNMMD